MSKNMTRKGLAFGAGFALVASGLAAAPAQADGITGFIPLAPTTKPTTALAAEARDGETFRLQASPASTVMGSGNVKFLVEDPNAVILPHTGTTGADSDALADSTTDFNDADATLDSVALDVDNVANGKYLIMSDTDVILDDGDDAATETIVLPKDTLVQGVVDSDFLTFKSVNDITETALDGLKGTPTIKFFKGGDAVTDTDSLAVGDLAGKTAGAPGTGVVQLTTSGVADGTYLFYTEDALILGDADDGLVAVTVLNAHEVVEITVDSNVGTFSNPRGTVLAANDELAGAENAVFIDPDSLGSARAADNSYVIDSGQSTAGDQPVIELIATEDDVSRSASVTAFVDLFADDSIAASEYASEPVTVQFVDEDDLTVTTDLVAPNEGDQTLTAKVTTSPMLNEGQLGNTDWVRAIFTREDSAVTAISLAMTQNDTTGVWSNATGIELDSADDQFLLYTDDDTAINGDGDASADYDGEWGFTVTAQRGDGDNGDDGVNNETISKIEIASTGVVTVTTTGDHGLRSGDKVRVSVAAAEVDAVEVATEATDRTITVTGAKTFTYTVTETTTITAGSDDAITDNTNYLVTTYTAGGGDSIVDRVFAGGYSARAVFETTATGDKYKAYGSASKKGTLATKANDVVFSTVGTNDVQAISDKGNSVDTNGDLLLRAGTASATVTATIVDDDGDAVGAGRNVALTMSNRSANVRVNGEKSTDALTTDANGQVTITVTSSLALKNEAVDIKAVAEGAAESSIRVKWVKAALKLKDLNVTDSEINLNQDTAGKEERYVAEGASYDMRILVADQWGVVADSDDYRLKVSGEGVTEGFETLTDGIATVTVTDSQVKTSFDTTVELQKKGTDGTFADLSTAVAVTVNTKTDDNPGIQLGADGSSLYGFDGSETADLSSVVSLKSIVERDLRTAFVAQPAYKNDVVVTGKVVDAGTNTALGGAVVTMSGPSNILFSTGQVDSRGSITFLADEGNGEFDVKLYSTSAQEDTEITVTALGVSKTVDVTFTGQTAGEGTVLSITAPDNVSPATTFQVTATLQDELGNGVSTGTDGSIKITRTGSGITFGTLPTNTDANGEASFSVLLGANDTADITVTVSYDQNGDGDYKDKKDLTTTKTITVGDAPVDQKVNAGSFKGYVAVYARGYEGQRLSAKIGNDWVIVDPIVNNESDDLHRTTDFTGAGVDIAVRIYIDRVLVDTINLTTK